MDHELQQALAKVEAENDALHTRMGYWREKAGELEAERDSLRDLLRDFLAETPECAWTKEARAALAGKEGE